MTETVVDLREYRINRMLFSKRTAFYLVPSHRHVTALPTDFTIFDILEVESELDLKRILQGKRPEILFIHSEMNWMDPITLIEHMNQNVSCPIVLVNERKPFPKSIIKRAYALGIDDVLSLPITKSAFFDVMNVLLRLKLGRNF